MSKPFPKPGVQPGKRIIISVIEQRARDEPLAPWVSVPVDNNDLSKGYIDITYGQLNNAANHAAQWFLRNLPASSQAFQPIAYVGPKDLRYAILAVAAGKLHKKLILPNPALSERNLVHLLTETKCEVYLGTEDMSDAIKAVLLHVPGVQYVTAPKLNALLQDTKAVDIEFGRSWDEAKDDPWLVFHSSGTTGNPKSLTHTFHAVANLEVPAALEDVVESPIHQYANKRWYTHMPTLHYVGMAMSLLLPAFVNMTAILSPPDPSIEAVADILHLARADGALFTPPFIDQMVSFPAGLKALQNLEFVHYVGAPLERSLGDQLTPYTKLTPVIGCTEAGYHLSEARPGDKDDWDYYSFQKHAGVTFERRADDLYEMVFIRQAECAVQPIFIVFPELSRFATGDLWSQHPTRAGLWKPMGRTDDFVTLSDAKQYFVSPLEKEIEQHPGVEAAVIGGDGLPVPVLLIELSEHVKPDDGQRGVLQSLEPSLAKIREESSLKLEIDLTIIAQKNKPFVRTVKGTVARAPTLKLYEDEVKAMLNGP